MSPNQLRTATFTTVRKGWDPAEVAAFLERAADSLEQAQNHATAMEARARAAVAKLQDLTAGDPTPPRSTVAPPPSPAVPTPPPAAPAIPADDEREIISRTLVLAQRAADEAVNEARAEAERLVEEARDEARREGSDERRRIRDEVDSLSARRGFLQSDVEHLENFLLDQRERLRSAASTLVDMAEKVPGGLGYLRPPLLSGSDEPADVPASADPVVEMSAATEVVEAVAAVPDDDGAVGADEGLGEPSGDPEDEFVIGPTAAMPVIRAGDEEETGANDPTPPGLPLPPDAR